MLRYIMKRLLMIIPVILGISFIIFTVMNFTPGNPARLILGESATTEDVMALEERMGLNDPFLKRYFDFVTKAARGDFGLSYRSQQPVMDEILARFPATLNLAFWSSVIMVIIAIPVGIVSAVRQYSILDYIVTVISYILTSMPSFWLGLILILAFSLHLGWLPATGVETWKHYILPCITLAAALIASTIRMTRSSMLEVIRSDYIRTARSKGVSEGKVIFKHALRNALLPIITLVGMNFATMLGGTMIIESVFAMPGLGQMTIIAIRMKDTPLVIASVVFVAILISIVNLIIDILYTYIDPRLRTEYSSLAKRKKAEANG